MENNFVKNNGPTEAPSATAGDFSRPHCSASLEWNRGPAMGGEGTGGGLWWQDSETLLIVIELAGGGREIWCVGVMADATGVDFQDSEGNIIGWGPEAVSWWAKLTDDHLPKTKVWREPHRKTPMNNTPENETKTDGCGSLPLATGSAVSRLTDSELFDAIREQVNLSRNHGGHQSKRTRELAAEAQNRGWNLRRPNTTV